MSVAYGVELRGSELRVVRAERSAGRLHTETLPAADPGFREAARSGVDCAGCLSARESFTRWVEAPFRSRSKALKVMPTLLDVNLPFPLEECAAVYLAPAPTAQGGTRALAVAARFPDIARCLDAHRAAGVDPALLDHEGLALWSLALRELPADPVPAAGWRALVHLAPDHTALVVGRGSEYLNTHALRSPDAAQINRLLRTYADAGSQRVQWVFSGPGAAAAATALQHELECDWPGTFQTIPDPDTCLARALATRALLEGPTTLNLRTGALEHPALTARRGRAQRFAVIAAVVAGLLLCGANAAFQLLLKQRETATDRAFAALARDLADLDLGGAKGEHAIKIVRDRVARRLESTRPFVAAFSPSLVSVLADAAELARKHDLRFDTILLDRDAVSIAGSAGDWNGCDPLVARLAQAGFAARLDRKDAQADERIPFTLTAGSAP